MNTYIIAEAGINANGNLETAKRMIDTAKLCGADCIKFQYFFENEVKEVWDSIKGYRFTRENLTELNFYCNKVKIDFLCSCFGKDSALGLSLICDKIKVPSGKIVDLELLKYISNKFEEFYLSTGMATGKEIIEAVKILNTKNINILHCISAYPPPINQLNLRAIKHLKSMYLTKRIGFSDHTKSIYTGAWAVLCGAEVIEKHFTLDMSMDGPDHNMSLEPIELGNYISIIREAEKALGDGKLKCEECEEALLFRRKKNEEYSDIYRK